jgi:hypothetical protein
MVVNYTTRSDSFMTERPRQWSNARLAYSGLNRNFDLSTDGKRFLVGLPIESRELPNHVIFVVNFFDEVRRRTR